MTENSPLRQKAERFRFASLGRVRGRAFVRQLRGSGERKRNHADGSEGYKTEQSDGHSGPLSSVFAAPFASQRTILNVARKRAGNHEPDSWNGELLPLWGGRVPSATRIDLSDHF